MRVTNHFATQQAIELFTRSRDAMNEAMLRSSTGRRVDTASDDPSAARTIMQNDSDQRAIDQRQRTVDAAVARMTAEESAFNQINELLTRAKELAIQQSSDTSTPAMRQAVAAEANQLLAQALQIANTQHDGGYLFGGLTPQSSPYLLNSTDPAFSFSVATPVPDGAPLIDLGQNQLMATGHSGLQVFGDETGGVLDCLGDLAQALVSGDGDAVASTISGIDAALQTTQVLTAETGAWRNRLDSISQAGRDRSLALDTSTTAVRDVDMEAAITELVARQTAFQAAMAATARTFGLSLTDYL